MADQTVGRFSAAFPAVCCLFQFCIFHRPQCDYRRHALTFSRASLLKYRSTYNRPIVAPILMLTKLTHDRQRAIS